MASITINPIGATITKSSDITGEEKLVTIDKQGKPSIITVNLVIDKIDDDIIDRIDDPIYEKVMEDIMDDIDDAIEERLDNFDPNNSFSWNEVN